MRHPRPGGSLRAGRGDPEWQLGRQREGSPSGGTGQSSRVFTGIVHGWGLVQSREPTRAGERLVIEPAGVAIAGEAGASVSVSGACLTVAAARSRSAAPLVFDVVPETLAKTTLGSLGPGDRVNLEPAARADTALDGHVVQGHVEGVGRVEAVDRSDGWRVRVRPPTELMPCIVPKGSVTMDGVSLTVAAVDAAEGWFEVALIPTTLERTTLGDLGAGDRVNVETDVLARTVVHWLRHYASCAAR